jgi:hypothetical protein
MPRSVKVLMGPSGMAKISGSLFKFGKVFDGPQGALRAVSLLIEHSPKADGIKPQAPGLRPDIVLDSTTSKVHVFLVLTSGTK